MKTYKDFKAFERRITKSCDWDDYFRVDGKLYRIYEYGGGNMMKLDYCYVYFLNRRTKTLLYVKYDLNPYKFKSFEVIEDAILWR